MYLAKGNIRMTLAQAIYERSLRLPEHAAREALDFIEFLEHRYAAQADGAGEPALDEAARREALDRLAGLRIPWSGKPIADRAAMYDDARGGR
jgi:hypothetical protein